MTEKGPRLNSKGTTGALQEIERFAPDRFEDGRLSEHGLDPGIRLYVLILRSQGIETFQSCQGGPGHTYLEPTIEFHGGKSEGPRAVAAAFAYGLPVSELRRVWNISDGELDGPIWSMTFAVKADVHFEAVAVREASYFDRKKTGRDAG